MKPEIGRKVYCIYDEGILVDYVAFIGNESFIIDSLSDCTNSDSWEWYYEDYEIEWFTELKKAKEELYSRYKEEYGDDLKIKKKNDRWYEIEED